MESFARVCMDLNPDTPPSARERKPEGGQPLIINLIPAAHRSVFRMDYLVHLLGDICGTQPVGNTLPPPTSAISKDCKGVGDQLSWYCDHSFPPFTLLGRRANTVPGVICASASEMFSGVTSEPSLSR